MPASLYRPMFGTWEPPRWRSRVGVECTAMGIAGHDFVRRRGRLAVRVQISVGDLCETRAPEYLLLPVPRLPDPTR